MSDTDFVQAWHCGPHATAADGPFKGFESPKVAMNGAVRAGGVKTLLLTTRAGLDAPLP